jgi:hypothetical protein
MASGTTKASDNELIQPLKPLNGQGRVRRHERIGGMLNYYYRAA